MKTGRGVVITGAAGGIGAALVRRFLESGDAVLGLDRDAEALEALRRQLGGIGHLATKTVNIASEEACLDAAETARETLGHVEVLINCAGHFPITPFEQMSAAQWRDVVGINLDGTFFMVKAMLPLMKDRGWGRIVNFGSGGFFKGTPGQSHYLAAKGGVVGLSRCLASELGGYGLTVNIVTPGVTLTAAARRIVAPEHAETRRLQRALKREEVAEDLVGAVYFLASPDADFITGQILNVDGGGYMH